MAGIYKKLFAGLFATFSACAAVAAPEPVTNRWVVNTGSMPAADVLQALQARLGVPVKLVRPMLQPGSVLLELPKLPAVGTLQSVLNITNTMQSVPGVVFASPDITLRRAAVAQPNDESYANNQSSYMEQGAYASLNMLNVWGRTRGSARVVIAVLDSGVLFDHPDLKGRLLAGYDFVSQPTPPTGTRESGTVSDSGSNDGDGRDANPADPGDAPPVGLTCSDGSQTSSFHGTAVASVAVAQSNNGRFLTGMDWNAKVLPLRVSGRCGLATSSDIIDAMYWATGSGRVDPLLGVNPNPANIINLSFASDLPLGSTCSGPTATAVRTAIADARTANVAVVVSGGNNSGGSVQFPASCPGTIAAIAAQNNGLIAGYSAKGASGSDLVLAAPGDAAARYVGANNLGVATGARRGAPDPARHNVLLFQGTSFSAPMVAGALSLLKAVHPNLSTSEAIALLRNSARAFPPNANLCPTLLFGNSRCNCTASSCGAGILNPLDAVVLAQKAQPGVPIANAPESRVVNGDGGFSLDSALSTNSDGQSSGLTYRWRQVFGNPLVLASTNGAIVQVQSGMSGNVAELELTVTDTGSNRENVSQVRLVSASADERLFKPNTPSGSTPVSPSGSAVVNPSQSSPTASANAPAGGGGGSLSYIGFLAMCLLVAAFRRSSSAFGIES